MALSSLPVRVLCRPAWSSPVHGAGLSLVMDPPLIPTQGLLKGGVCMTSPSSWGRQERALVRQGHASILLSTGAQVPLAFSKSETFWESWERQSGEEDAGAPGGFTDSGGP